MDIYNQNLINYLMEHGEQPIKDYGYSAYFAQTDNFKRLRDLYQIQYYIIRNKL